MVVDTDLGCQEPWVETFLGLSTRNLHFLHVKTGQDGTASPLETVLVGQGGPELLQSKSIALLDFIRGNTCFILLNCYLKAYNIWLCLQ